MSGYRYAMEHGLDSRFAALHRAVCLLRDMRSAAAYESAWKRWTSDREADTWESTINDGLTDLTLS